MIRLEFDDQEVAAFYQICDLALRQGGFAVFDAVSVFRQKIVAQQNPQIAMPPKRRNGQPAHADDGI